MVVLLGLKLEELSWDYAKPSQENNEDCLPCLFIQFCVIENGRRVSKILQIFSRQAVQMDALINTFVDELKQRVAMYSEDHEQGLYGDATSTDADGKGFKFECRVLKLQIHIFSFRLLSSSDNGVTERNSGIMFE